MEKEESNAPTPPPLPEKPGSLGKKELVITKTNKNSPLSPEEQQKAFEEYLASMEKEDKDSNAPPVPPPLPEKPGSFGEKELVIAKTNKNRPLSPEEQQKAFEEYLAAMEENELANNLKNNAKASAKLKMEAQEDTKVPVRVNKNRPLTREEQEIAVKEFMARQKAEKNKSQSLSPKPVKTTSLRLPRVLNRKPSKYIHYSILIWIP